MRILLRTREIFLNVLLFTVQLRAEVRDPEGVIDQSCETEARHIFNPKLLLIYDAV